MPYRAKAGSRGSPWTPMTRAQVPQLTNPLQAYTFNSSFKMFLLLLLSQKRLKPSKPTTNPKIKHLTVLISKALRSSSASQGHTSLLNDYRGLLTWYTEKTLLGCPASKRKSKQLRIQPATAKEPPTKPNTEGPLSIWESACSFASLEGTSHKTARNGK